MSKDVENFTDESVSTVSVIKRLFPYLKNYRGRFIFALCSMVIYGATDGALPFLIKFVLDKVFAARDADWLWPLAIGLMIFAVVRGVFGFLQKYLSTTVGLSIVKDLRNDINRHLLSLSPSFFSKHQTGSLISRVTNDTLLVRMAVTDSIASLIRDSIRCIALVATAIALDPVLAAIAVVGFPLGILPIVKFGKKVRRFSKRGQDSFGNLTGLLQETIVGHKVVQAFGMQNYETKRFDEENEHLTKTLFKSEKYGALSAPTNELIGSMAVAMIVLYGGYTVIGGERTQGDFIAFITALFLLYDPLKKLSRVNNVVQTGVASALRIFEILDAKPDIQDKPNASNLVLSDDFSIDYQNVSFFYDEGEWVLKDIDLQIGRGETLALVGMSGGGKSTLADLLPRFYDPQKGCIRIADQDLRDVKLDSLRQHIAVVGQHTFLFNDSVLNNIAYGCIAASEEQVVQAAKAANAHQFISRLPQGYKTVIGEQGFKLSGGERQRLAIARALLRNAPILVLDEATAALDSESESLVQEAIDTLVEGRTVVVIAHRLATVRNANKIAVVVKGQIVEQGTHQELLSLDKEYAKLYRIQFKETSVAAVQNG